MYCFKRCVFLLYLKIEYPNLFFTMKSLRILLSHKLSLLWAMSKLLISKILRKRSLFRLEKELTHLLIEKKDKYPFEKKYY